MGGLTDWKAVVTLGQLPARKPLWMKFQGKWEATTPYELLEHFRFPRFMAIEVMEVRIGASLMRDEDVAALEAAE